MPSTTVTFFPIPDAGQSVTNNSTTTYTVASNEFARVVGHFFHQVTGGSFNIVINSSTLVVIDDSANDTGFAISDIPYAEYWLDDGDTFQMSGIGGSEEGGFVAQRFNK